MKKTELAYAAGLIDGEGCIGTYFHCYNGNYQLRITVEMCDKSGLLLLHKLFGGKFYYKKAKRPRRARHLWMVFNSDAAAVLRLISPYLRVKNKHAQIALEGTWTNISNLIKGKKLSKKENNKRKSINKRIKKLNERGYYGKNK